MKVNLAIDNFNEIDHSTILTIGTFDGVHIGHQKIIEKLNSSKTSQKDSSVILTFFPHPRQVLQFGNHVKMLTTMEEKIMLLDRLKLDYLVIQPFTEEFANIPALRFIKDILVKGLKIKKIIIGYDHHFGKNREGNFDQLKAYQDIHKYDLEEITAQEIKRVSVSSTKIRRAVEDGAIEKANQYLGYSYLLTGYIVQGQSIGRTINYPTANLHISETYKLIPKTGVYIVQTYLNGEKVYGIMNIGVRPTIDGKNKTIEIHFLDFNANLYGKKIQIEVLKRLRNEKKFNSLNELTSQIKSDEQLARHWILKTYQ